MILQELLALRESEHGPKKLWKVLFSFKDDSDAQKATGMAARGSATKKVWAKTRNGAEKLAMRDLELKYYEPKITRIMQIEEDLNEEISTKDLESLRSMYGEIADSDQEFSALWTVVDGVKTFLTGVLAHPEEIEIDAKQKLLIKAVLKSPELLKKLAAMIEADIEARSDD